MSGKPTSIRIALPETPLQRVRRAAELGGRSVDDEIRRILESAVGAGDTAPAAARPALQTGEEEPPLAG